MPEPSTALDKLASLLGFYRGTQIDNEFWVSLTLGNSVVQQLKSLQAEVKTLQARCYDLEMGKRDR